MTTERFLLDATKTNKDVLKFFNKCVKKSLATDARPFDYGGLKMRYLGPHSAEYFQKRVVRLFRNSHPRVFSSSQFLILDGNFLYVLLKYSQDWTFLVVPDNLQNLVREFGKTHDIYCDYEMTGYELKNVHHLTDYR